MEDKLYELQWCRDMLLARIDMVKEEENMMRTSVEYLYKYHGKEFDEHYSDELKSIRTRISQLKSILYYIVNLIETIQSIKDNVPE